MDDRRRQLTGTDIEILVLGFRSFEQECLPNVGSPSFMVVTDRDPVDSMP